MDIMDNITEILESYGDRLSDVGITCDLRKKYFENPVDDAGYSSRGLLRSVEHRINSKREKKYKNVPNRYHVAVLRFEPLEKDILKGEFCREYAFFLKGIGRSHKGLEPEEYITDTEKILKKIRRRIEKTLKEAEKSTPEKVCRDRWYDLCFRYLASQAYGYKKSFLGRDMNDIEMKFLIAAFVICIVAVIGLTAGEIYTKTR